MIFYRTLMIWEIKFIMTNLVTTIGWICSSSIEFSNRLSSLNSKKAHSSLLISDNWRLTFESWMMKNV